MECSIGSSQRSIWQRRREGTRCITVGINEAEVAALVAKGYLAVEKRLESTAIKKAIESVLSDMAFNVQYESAVPDRPRQC